jgi:hypothetical protein
MWFPVGYQQPTGTTGMFLTVLGIPDGYPMTDRNTRTFPNGI